MALVPIMLANAPSAHAWTRIALYVKVRTSLSTVTTTLVDLDAGPAGYFRLALKGGGFLGSSPKFVAEAAYAGGTHSKELNPSLTIESDRWYWVMAAVGSDSATAGRFVLGGKVYGAAGATDGAVWDVVTASGGAPFACDASLGWGVNLSAEYADFPKSPEEGWKMDSLVVDVNDGAVDPCYALSLDWPPPTADIVPGAVTPGTSSITPTALYLCHEAIGSTAGVADSTAHGHDLLPGPQGMVIVSGGPY